MIKLLLNEKKYIHFIKKYKYIFTYNYIYSFSQIFKIRNYFIHNYSLYEYLFIFAA